jgi:two-component system OmpR family sensor kinase
LRDVIKDAVSVVESLLREKQQALEISCPPGLAVRADPRRLQQALVNILSNANRHTPTGTRIGVVAETVNGTAQLTISDNGPGIEPAALEAIFERFYRLPSSLDGSGLGLAIAKAVIEMQGGKLWAASQPGRGTNFYISLPLAGSEAQSSGDSEGSEGSDGTQSTNS